LQTQREPIFNIPSVVVATIAAIVAVHLMRTYGFTLAQDRNFLLQFAFFPARYDASILKEVAWPGGLAGQIWSFVTYAFIHADWTHLTLNSVWLLAFGSAVARRFGTLRFLAFFAVTAATGAALHLAMKAGDIWPMVGASAAISGCMAAALRFVFQSDGPLGIMRSGRDSDFRRPALPLLRALSEPRALIFLCVWLAVDFLFGATSLVAGDGQNVAWQAHIGGFLGGLLLFPLFDPVPRAKPRDDDRNPDPRAATD
jgi:membrane associated rhomboid family serine protease